MLAGDLSAPGLWQVGLWALTVLAATSKARATVGLPDSGEERQATAAPFDRQHNAR